MRKEVREKVRDEEREEVREKTREEEREKVKEEERAWLATCHPPPELHPHPSGKRPCLSQSTSTEDPTWERQPASPLRFHDPRILGQRQQL